MSSSGEKKLINKDELRRLMEMQKQSSNGERRIDSPLARYNNLGQLSCLVCNCLIKNEVLWKAHVLKKDHKMNVERYKAQLLQKPTDSKILPQSLQQTSAQKRKTTDSDLRTEEKKIKLSNESSKTSQFHNHNSAVHSQEKKTKSGDILTGYDISQNSDEDDESEMEVDVASHLPSCEEAADIKGAPSLGGSKIVMLPMLPEGLPEGFIDDPVMDAKVRNVPYKDKMEEQLELFQKEIKQQQTVSEALLEEDDDQRYKERDLYEIEEQMHNFSRIIDAANKKDQLKSEIKETMNTMNATNENSEDDDDSDEDDGFNWRAKKVFKK